MVHIRPIQASLRPRFQLRHEVSGRQSLRHPRRRTERCAGQAVRLANARLQQPRESHDVLLELLQEEEGPGQGGGAVCAHEVWDAYLIRRPPLGPQQGPDLQELLLEPTRHGHRLNAVDRQHRPQVQ